MEKEFVPYELALRMKQLRFNERCIMHWWKGKLSYYQMGDFSPTHTSAPIYSQAFRWFREKYGLIGWVEGKRMFMYRIESSIESDGQLDCSPFRTYEEAELECLEKLIEIVEQKEK